MKALKLDATYRPVEVIDALEALVLCIVGKAKAIETYAREICSPSRAFKLPAVIVLTNIVKYRFGGIMCNRQNIIWRDNNKCQYLNPGKSMIVEKTILIETICEDYLEGGFEYNSGNNHHFLTNEEMLKM